MMRVIRYTICCVHHSRPELDKAKMRCGTLWGDCDENKVRMSTDG